MAIGFTFIKYYCYILYIVKYSCYLNVLCLHKKEIYKSDNMGKIVKCCRKTRIQDMMNKNEMTLKGIINVLSLHIMFLFVLFYNYRYVSGSMHICAANNHIHQWK